MTAYSAKFSPKQDAPKKAETRPDGTSLYFNNNGLFSENYLRFRLPEEKHDSFILEHWETEPLPAFSECYEWMLSTWSEMKDILKDQNEAQLEDKWIRPILKRLGWTYEVQDRLQKRGKTQIPDYSLFADDKSYIKAKSATTDAAYFKHALAVADAKAMGINLDGIGRTNNNPSYQIIRYMEDTGQTWGILTDGEYWRLYSLNSESKFSTYYEINIRKALASRDDERFKYFFNFFRKEAFLKKGSNAQSFLDVVYKGGEQYARSVETQLKERAFRITQSICRGFATQYPSLGEQELNEVYQHSLYYLFRLIFILNAEAKGIFEVNDLSDYFPASLRTLAIDLKHDFEIGRNWSAQTKSYQHISQLMALLEKGDKSIGVVNLGSEIFSRAKDYYKKRSIPDSILNPAIVELACAYDESDDLKFIDYKRLSPDHLGSLFEGLLEYKLVEAKEKLADDAGKIVAWKDLPEKKRTKLKASVIEKAELYLENGTGERKSTGSYYTPSYIVDYLVSKVVGPLCDGKEAQDILNLRICDPAMGSGHFLIGTVKFLEEKILDALYRKEDDPTINPEEIRHQVLHNCIHGVDINPLAVELAKFSLWMYSVRRGHELEPLDDQLKFGNSLVDKNAAYSKSFNWPDVFPAIFKGGGFSGLVGNPPFNAELSADTKKMFKLKYKEQVADNLNTAYLFCLRAMEIAAKSGRVGFVLPKSLYYSSTWTRARQEVLPYLEETGDVSEAFKDVKLEEIFVVLDLKNSSSKVHTAIVKDDAVVATDSISKSEYDKAGIFFAGYSRDELKVGALIRANSEISSDHLQVKRGFLIQGRLQRGAKFPVLRCKSIKKFGLTEIADHIPTQEAQTLLAGNPWIKEHVGVIQNIVAHVTKPVGQIILMASCAGKDAIGLDNISYFLPKNQLLKGKGAITCLLFNSWIMSWYMYRFCYSKAIRTMRFDNYHIEKMPLPKSLIRSLEKEKDLLSSTRKSILSETKKLLSEIHKRKTASPMDVTLPKEILSTPSVALECLGEILMEDSSNRAAVLLSDAILLECLGLQDHKDFLATEYGNRTWSGYIGMKEAEALEDVG